MPSPISSIVLLNPLAYAQAQDSVVEKFSSKRNSPNFQLSSFTSFQSKQIDDKEIPNPYSLLREITRKLPAPIENIILRGNGFGDPRIRIQKIPSLGFQYDDKKNTILVSDKAELDLFYQAVMLALNDVLVTQNSSNDTSTFTDLVGDALTQHRNELKNLYGEDGVYRQHFVNQEAFEHHVKVYFAISLGTYLQDRDAFQKMDPRLCLTFDHFIDSLKNEDFDIMEIAVQFIKDLEKPLNKRDYVLKDKDTPQSVNINIDGQNFSIPIYGYTYQNFPKLVEAALSYYPPKILDRFSNGYKNENGVEQPLSIRFIERKNWAHELIRLGHKTPEEAQLVQKHARGLYVLEHNTIWVCLNPKDYELSQAEYSESFVFYILLHETVHALFDVLKQGTDQNTGKEIASFEFPYGMIHKGLEDHREQQDGKLKDFGNPERFHHLFFASEYAYLGDKRQHERFGGEGEIISQTEFLTDSTAKALTTDQKEFVDFWLYRAIRNLFAYLHQSKEINLDECLYVFRLGLGQIPIICDFGDDKKLTLFAYQNPSEKNQGIIKSALEQFSYEEIQILMGKDVYEELTFHFPNNITEYSYDPKKNRIYLTYDVGEEEIVALLKMAIK